ncbi:MAG TPA: glycosyltransferase family 4 protein [Candidatus Sulfotelmatobacter sp.]|nr:glycosyltransferase family 4 protein [Candidatus Sulfotelmatobacter sp.]
MRRFKVVHLITRLELGGAQQNTLYCAANHDRTRFEVGLWAGAGGPLDSAARSIADADVRILPWLLHPIRPTRDAIATARLARALSGVDLLHTHSSKAGLLGRAAARLAGVPAVVHTVHGWSFNATQPAPLRRLYIGLERRAARWCDRLICVSEADRRIGLSLGIGKASQYAIVRSGIDPEEFRLLPGMREAARAALGYQASDIVVGTIANLKPQKGPLDFVEVARLAHARNPSLRFFFVGDGPLRPEVERRIGAAGLTGIVRLLGWREDVRELLAAMDIFLLTSLFEGLPRAVLQAMAAARPVVATDTGGTAEVIEDASSGYLVRIAAPGEAAERVLRLAGDSTLREAISRAARARLGAAFDVRNMVVSLETLYLDLLAAAPSSQGATVRSHLGGSGSST